MKHTRRKLLAGAVLAIGLSVSVYGTTAYFNAADVAHNVITMGNVKIELQEWADDKRTKPFENINGAMPGGSYDKIVEVENTGSNPAFVRIRLEQAITQAEGAQGKADTNMIHLDINETMWTAAVDEETGQWYYYYNQILQPGETTAPLFTKVQFDLAMGNEFQNARVDIRVQAQATQAENQTKTIADLDENGNNKVEAITKGWEAKGWPADAVQEDKPEQPIPGDTLTDADKNKVPGDTLTDADKNKIPGDTLTDADKDNQAK